MQVSLELEPAAELQRTGALSWRVAGSEAGDFAEGRTADRRARIAVQQRVVGDVERLEANLELALVVNGEGTEETRVRIGDARSAEFVAVGGAEDRRSDL